MLPRPNLAEAILFALANAPDRVSIIDARDHATTRRKTKKRKSDHLLFKVDRDLLLSAEDHPRGSFVIAMVAVPCGVVERMDSRIVLPGERRL